MTGSAVFSPAEETAWFGLLQTHARVTARIEADLLASHQLPYSAVEVLCHLWATREPQPVRVLAGQLITISPTRASRVMQDLVDAGHLQRGADQDDGRISLISLTPNGLEFADAVTRTFQAAVRKHFLGPLDTDDLAAMARIWSKIDATQRD
ncbi:MarR family winged helix-turn-helix transcriptional regulator [Streptomyces mirabilis]